MSSIAEELKASIIASRPAPKWILKSGMHFVSVRDYWAVCCDENRATKFDTREEAVAAARMTGELSARSLTPVELPR